MQNSFFIKCVIGLAFGLLALLSTPILASPDSLTTAQESPQEKQFKVGDFIFEHIGDSHEWHLATFGSTHVSIPLPVIVYSRQRAQLFFFFSNRFHHGHTAYKGFRLETEGDLKGKIVEVGSDGSTILAGPLPLDFSIKKNVVAIFFSMGLMLWLFIGIGKTYQRNPNEAPKGIQNLIEIVIFFVRDDIVKPSLGNNYLRFFPFLLSIFFFIFINNLLGLIPIFPAGANTTGNIAVTMVLAFFTMLTINLNGNKHYWKHIFNTPGVPIFLKVPIPIMPLVEVFGIIIKPFVLMIRLFANMLSGHIIALVFVCLIFVFGSISAYAGYGISVLSVILVIFMTILDILVAAIQAYVFTMLSAIFIGMATSEHN